MIQEWSDATSKVLQSSWQMFLAFIPNLLGAIIIFVIGWFIALGVGRLITEILARLKIDKFFERTGWKEALEKAEISVSLSEFVGAIIKWILVIVFLLPAVEILGLPQFAGFLTKFVAWLPNLVVAVIVFVVAVILADILEKIVKASVNKIGVGYARFLGESIRWAIYIFAGMAILRQLGVATTIVDTLVKGLVAVIVLSFGLAFGLGGQEAAARAIEEIKRKISQR